MIKTEKSVFLRYLETIANNSRPSQVDAIVVDGFFLLHTLSEVTSTFSGIALQILKKVCRFSATEIHLVFDRIISLSIKDIERERRCNSEEQINYSAFNKNGRRPANFIKSLRSKSFKKSVIEFLVEEWSGDEYHQTIGSKKLYVSIETKCYLYTAQQDIVIRQNVQELESLQEEADTRMMLHLSFLAPDSKVIIKSPDTDVLVIALYCIPHLKNNIKVWLEVGSVTKNTLRYININEVFNALGHSICAALPAFHCFTGCDYTPSFFKKGKIKPFEILKRSPEMQRIFSNFGTSNSVSEEDVNKIEEFVCKMYQTKAVTVDEARFELFYKTCKPTSKKIFKNIKSFEGSLLPPNKSVLLQQIYRCVYICRIWKNALTNAIIDTSPLDFGWSMEGNRMALKWFEGNATPETIEDILGEYKDASGSDEPVSEDSSDESDQE